MLVDTSSGGLCSTESPDDCENYLLKMGFAEVAMNDKRHNAFSFADPMMQS